MSCRSCGTVSRCRPDPGIRAGKKSNWRLATLQGALTTLGEDGVRGAQVALKQAGGKLLGKDVELLFTSTDASPDSALRAAKKLVEQDKVSIIPRENETLGYWRHGL